MISNESIGMSKYAYVRGNEVGNEIKAKTPPNGAKDIACDFLHSSHQGNAVVDLWEELEQENQ
jgi:hypothetical protein